MERELLDAANELSLLSKEYGRLVDCDDEYFELDILDYLSLDNTSSWKVATGATKIVLINDNLDYVLKTPIYGEVEEDWETGELIFHPWIGARYSSTKDNYCETEIHLYKAAAGSGLGDLFASIEPLLTKDSRTVYVSERCIPYNQYSSKPSEKSLSFVEEKELARGTSLTSEVTAKFIDDYGLDKTLSLLSFLAVHKISDLHYDNIMLSTKTNKIIISDYAGFDS